MIKTAFFLLSAAVVIAVLPSHFHYAWKLSFAISLGLSWWIVIEALRKQEKVVAEQKQTSVALRELLSHASQERSELVAKHNVAQTEIVAKLEERIDQINELRIENYQLTLLPKEDTKQLRNQFEEKSQILHQTRKELFHIENAYLALQLEAQAKDLEENPLALQVRELETECQDLQNQVDILQDIVTDLLKKKKVTKPRPSKKAKAEILPGFLGF